MNRPNFKEIKTFEEFRKYYWYKEELVKICKILGLEYRGTKLELNKIIEEYFKGNKILKIKRQHHAKTYDDISLDSSLLECGFSFNQKFREYFSNLTNVSSFKFNTDMASTLRKVKASNDTSFTIGDMLKVYNGELNYTKYDNSSCEWNKFVKDFCEDEISDKYTDKLKVASILWKKVKESKNDKVYSRELLNKYLDEIKIYCN